MTELRAVECSRHGQGRAAYVCRHLLAALSDRAPRGVHWLYDEDACVNAWCDDGEAFLAVRGNEWNEEAEAHAGIRLVCQTCFQGLETFNEMKDLN